MGGFGVIKLGNQAAERADARQSGHTGVAERTQMEYDNQEHKSADRPQEMKSPEGRKAKPFWSKNEAKRIVEQTEQWKEHPEHRTTPLPAGKEQLTIAASSSSSATVLTEPPVSASPPPRSLMASPTPQAKAVPPSPDMVETIPTPFSSPVDTGAAKQLEEQGHLRQAEIEALVGRAALDGKPISVDLIRQANHGKPDLERCEALPALGTPSASPPVDAKPSLERQEALPALGTPSPSPVDTKPNLERQEAVPALGTPTTSPIDSKPSLDRQEAVPALGTPNDDPKSSLQQHQERVREAEQLASQERDRMNLKRSSIAPKRQSLVNTEQHSALKLKTVPRPTEKSSK